VKEFSMNIKFVGIDLAKNIFQIHGADEAGHVILRKTVTRAKLLDFVRQLEPAVIGMEACSTAHYWGRRFVALGHDVRLMPPGYVKPFVKTNKNDQADAEAICEAMQRPTMRFVTIKTPQQQAVLLLHRARTGFVKTRTACANQIRAILSEFGLPIPIGINHVAERARLLIEDTSNEIPSICRRLVQSLLEHLAQLSQRIQGIETELTQWYRQDETSTRIAEIPGVGLLGATAIAASVGNATQFRNGRQLAAWMGLVPRQHSSGAKQRLLGISKHGDAYLRTLLIHGARSVLSRLKMKPEALDCWAVSLLTRRSMNLAATALANKMARTIWALIRHERRYSPDFQPMRPISSTA
jgi:transposase